MDIAAFDGIFSDAYSLGRGLHCLPVCHLCLNILRSPCSDARYIFYSENTEPIKAKFLP